MAEIEHFCDPAEKDHPKFGSVKDQTVVLFSACDQMDGVAAKTTTIGEAVASVRVRGCGDPCGGRVDLWRGAGDGMK